MPFKYQLGFFLAANPWIGAVLFGGCVASVKIIADNSTDWLIAKMQERKIGRELQ